MASNRWGIIFFVATLVALASSVSAKVFTVGDEKGWTLNFDYEAWAKGKEFFVGDQLVFRYAAGKHNVFRVNGTLFQQCNIPPTNEALTSGMKLFINVLPQSVPPTPLVSPAPSPVPSGKVFVVGDNYGWTLNFDYQAWATGKEFVVGDKLVFRYPIGKHNVFRVNGTQFQQCTIPAVNEALTSGYDVITLVTPGRKCNYEIICEDEAKRRNSGAKTKTFEENCYLLPYAVSSKEDMAYQRQLIIRIRVKDQFPIWRITFYLYAVCTVGR
ncbi:blue copper protein-like protein [Tanacetum coccineum]|uniref:Blue copper protein-like protein n=1 Tax=Tanacetum coccineum TaxID=301880 RepID=A0ABQ5APV4_9ASTR